MENSKRDFNGAAKFFLALSMAGIIITIITSALNISNYKFFGWDTSVLVKEIIVDVLILGAGVLTFMKKRSGVIALVILFFLRLFVTIQWNSNISTAYLLGSKTPDLIRDLAPFAIAMCFKKNGISGWKSMLASEEYLTEHIKMASEKDDLSIAIENKEEDSYRTEEVQDSISSVEMANSFIDSEPNPTPEQNNEVDTILNDVVESRKTQSVLNEKKLSSQKHKKTITEGFRSLNKYLKVGILSSLALIALFGILTLYVSVKSYPDYITSFGDKWKYTFNLPNNKLAKSLIYSATSKREKSLHLIVIPGFDEGVFTADRFYRNRADILRDYPSTKVYIATKQVKSVEGISNSQYYIIVPNEGEPYHKMGSAISSGWDFYGEIDSRKIYETKEFDCVNELAEEVRIIDKAASLPVSDMDIIKTIGGFYEQEGNLSKAVDYYYFALSKNRKNTELEGLVAYALALSGEDEEAKEQAVLALLHNSKEIHALSALAIVESEALNWGEAGRYAKKAIDYGAEDSNVYYVYCAALYKQGEIRLAQNYYNKAFELDRHNPRKNKYAEYAGAPFEVLAFHYSSSTGSKTIIPSDEKLVSSKCYYIDFKLDVNILRFESAKIGVKLYKNGTLMTGEGSKDGYTYYDEIEGSHPGQKTVYLFGWGNDSGGVWPAGTHVIEIWYKGNMVANDSFHVY